MKKPVYLLLACVILFTSLFCKKDNDGLPKASQIGANIMAAKVDGNIWQAKSCWSCVDGGKGLRTVYLPALGRLNILGEMVNYTTDISIILDVSGVNGLGKYQLEDDSASDSYARVINDKINNEFHTTTPSSGFVSITKLSESERIISGTFEFTASNTSNSVKVTQGRFDLKF